MKQSILNQFNNKIVFSLFTVLILYSCKKNEHNKNNRNTNSIKYIALSQGANLSKERQEKAFGKWKLTNIIYYDHIRDTSSKIKVNENVTVNEQGVFDHEDVIIANKYNTIGTYTFKNLDTLSTTYYIFKIGDSTMMMKSPLLFRIVNGKKTKDRARAEIYFIKQDIK
ncbi:hypothetical protein BEI02_18725 [Elizabethkingia sp. HvH-WGS333]|uniref:hypothetical protein n=1 Tax=Elizabethkingia TaxID=308865 RepID=UPI00074180B4|nr:MULTISPECIES: hypothetical protein [Elizabethkingia]KUG13455.1 hypothetical protein AMC91_02010 [Elizabethkingia miricola]MCL1656147.1 hypothetical protein [Elizabethkingia miricola]MCP1251013.1 hypothetical protein [Elizabethkingia sp. S0634]OIK44909.1 hypothetical protein BEI02_18725 [Elizabethkingia sp. HvH-WGS333]